MNKMYLKMVKRQKVLGYGERAAGFGERGEGKPADDSKGQCVAGEISDMRAHTDRQGRYELRLQTDRARTRPKT